jgi:hypothetical protein
MAAAAKALCVNLVNTLGSGRPRSEPAAFRDHLDSVDRLIVAGRLGELRLDRLAGEVLG